MPAEAGAGVERGKAKGLGGGGGTQRALFRALEELKRGRYSFFGCRASVNKPAVTRVCAFSAALMRANRSEACFQTDEE